MSSLLNEEFGYLIASIQRPIDPPGAMPHSLSFEEVKELYGERIQVTFFSSFPQFLFRL